MTQKNHNILIEYKDTAMIYRITKISNRKIIEVDEMFDDPILAKKFFDSLVQNIEYAEGFSANVSKSEKNKVQGYQAVYIASFGNLGVEVGFSIRPIVGQFKNLIEYTQTWQTGEDDYIEALVSPDEAQPKTFMERLLAFIK